jgi:hypothetical protein
MSWVTKLIDSVCVRFNGTIDDNRSIRINNYVVRVINDDELFSIKIVDFTRFAPPKQINNIFCDDLESNLEKTLKEII